MSIKIGIIGPTNLQKLSRILQKPEEFFVERAREIGRILAENKDCEVWINCDKGMIMEVGRAYKEKGGKKLVILSPAIGTPWPKDHIEQYEKYADELRKEPNWFWANYNVVSQPDFCICAGLSAGTLAELSYIKWNHQLKRGNLNKLFAIKELLRDSCLPPEIEEDIKEILIYINTSEELKKFFEKRG